jgi:hypothetical protein
LLSYRFVPWIFLLPVCWWIAAEDENQAVRRFGMFSLMYVYCYLAVISVSETKFRWYDAPMYPIAAGVIGMAIGATLVSVWKYVATAGCGRLGMVKFRARALVKWFLASAALTGIFGYPYFNNAYREVYRGGVPFRENDKTVTDTAQRFKAYYQQLRAANLPLGTRPLKVVNPHRYNLPLLFYSRVAELQKGYAFEVQWKQPWTGPFSASDVLVNCDAALGVAIRQRHTVKTLHRWASCETLLVEG